MLHYSKSNRFIRNKRVGSCENNKIICSPKAMDHVKRKRKSMKAMSSTMQSQTARINVHKMNTALQVDFSSVILRSTTMELGVDVGVIKLLTYSGHSLFWCLIIYGFHVRDNVFIMLRGIQRKRKSVLEQESITVGCIPPACQSYILRWSPDITSRGRGVPCLKGRTRGGGAYLEGLNCTDRSNASWVMVTWGPPP